MDSSRSGLLSTLIMTVPLIVVPAIALLRPPVPHPGISTGDLEASADDDFFSGFDGIDASGFGDPTSPRKMPADSDDGSDFSEIFDNPDVGIVNEGNSQLPVTPEFSEPQTTPPAAHSVDPFAPEPKSVQLPGPAVPSTDHSSGSHVPDAPRPIVPEANQELTLMTELTTMGVTRTLWFSPSATTVGFVAFLADESIAGTAASIQYRFEAIGTSRSDALQQVRDQILRWRRGPE